VLCCLFLALELFRFLGEIGYIRCEVISTIKEEKL
jgi:hypothetical protein